MRSGLALGPEVTPVDDATPPKFRIDLHLGSEVAPADTVPIQAPNPPAQFILPAYAYQEYVDDPNIVAFFTAYNTLAQGYLDWFNTTPLGVYTNANVTGQLLDWIGLGVYGIPRPSFSSVSTRAGGRAINAYALDGSPINGGRDIRTVTGTVANDDYYKRTLTWQTYLGDGRICTTNTLRKRVARFLFGPNGTDVSVSQAQAVSIEPGAGASDVTITIPSGDAAIIFSEALANGILAFPFQLVPTVTIV